MQIQGGGMCVCKCGGGGGKKRKKGEKIISSYKLRRCIELFIYAELDFSFLWEFLFPIVKSRRLAL